MTIAITIYENSTGRILRVVKCPQNMVDLQRIRAGEAKLVGVDSNPETQYVLNSVVVSRPVNSTIRSGRSLMNIPSGSTVRDNRGVSVPINSGTATVPNESTSALVSSPWPTAEVKFDFT